MFKIDTEQKTDNRWIAEIEELPGAMIYGATRSEAIAKVEALALQILADDLDMAKPEQLEVARYD